MPLLFILTALLLQFICTVWFTRCRVLGHGHKMWRVRERENPARLDVVQCMIPSAIYSLIYSLSQQRPGCFYLWGDKETSISTQLKPVTVYSVTLRWRVNCIPSPLGSVGQIPDKMLCFETVSISYTHLSSASHERISPSHSQGRATPPSLDARILK